MSAGDPRAALVEWADQRLEPRKRRCMLLPEVVRAPGYAETQLHLGARQCEPLVEILKASAADSSCRSTQPDSEAPKIYDLVVSMMLRAHGDADPTDAAAETERLLDFIVRRVGSRGRPSLTLGRPWPART